MTSAWDLSSIALGDTFDTNPAENVPLGLDFGDSGKRLYVAGRGTLTVREYAI